jgi:hypothetical protein
LGTSQLHTGRDHTKKAAGQPSVVIGFRLAGLASRESILPDSANQPLYWRPFLAILELTPGTRPSSICGTSKRIVHALTSSHRLKSAVNLQIDLHLSPKTRTNQG